MAGLERCERPVQALLSEAGDHPGRLVVGPEEKYGVTGRLAGFGCVVIAYLTFYVAIRWGIATRRKGSHKTARQVNHRKNRQEKYLTSIYLIVFYGFY